MIAIPAWQSDELPDVVRVLNAASPFDQFALDHVRARAIAPIAAAWLV